MNLSDSFYFKLGQLLGTLQDFLIRCEDKSYNDGDIDRIKTLTKDVIKKFYEQIKE